MARADGITDVQLWLVTQDQRIDVTDRLVALEVRHEWLVRRTERGERREKELLIQLEVLGELPMEITHRSVPTAIQVREHDRAGLWVGMVTESTSIRENWGRRTELRARGGANTPAWATDPRSET